MVEIYSKPDCVQCNMTKKLFQQLGIKYRETDVTKDEGALERLRAEGKRSLPVVVTADQSWMGFNPAKIKALA